jgi:RNA 2',3'-cyclic 3'-phosphodiesterase
VRLFVAVELPGAVRDAIAVGLGRLKRDQPGARWVRPESMHLTLKFLGERDESLVDSLDGAARAALARLTPATVRLEGGGFFPNEHHPRVAWLGGDGGGLDRWAQAVDEAAAALGVEREPRPYTLHLTLARVERPWGVRAVEHFVVQVGKWRVPEFAAGEAVLFRSVLGPAGPVHTALRRWPAGAVGGGGDGA